MGKIYRLSIFKLCLTDITMKINKNRIFFQEEEKLDLTRKGKGNEHELIFVLFGLKICFFFFNNLTRK